MTRMRNGAIKPPASRAVDIFRAPQRFISRLLFSSCSRSILSRCETFLFNWSISTAILNIISLSDLVIVPHVTPIHVAIEGTSSIAAASSCLSHRISVQVVSIMTSMNRRDIGDPQAAAAE
jgi:hypothetical protein